MNFAVPAEVFKSIPLDDLWIFQGKEPGPAGRRPEGGGGRRRAAVSVHLQDGRLDTRQEQPQRHDPGHGQHNVQGLDNDLGGAGHAEAWRPAGDALASERRRMAILDQGRGPHGRVQGRSERPDAGLPRRRRWVYATQPGSLHSEYRDHGPAGSWLCSGPPSTRRCRFRSGWCGRRPRWWHNISTSIRRCWRSSRRTLPGSFLRNERSFRSRHVVPTRLDHPGCSLRRRALSDWDGSAFRA